MAGDEERRSANLAALRSSSLDALVCCTPTSVLALSGYWPVMGASVAVATPDGEIIVAAPEDESELAQATSSATLVTYHPESLNTMAPPIQALSKVLEPLLRSLSLSGKNVGVEFRQGMQPVSYVASSLFHTSLIDLLESFRLGARYVSADPVLDALKGPKTSRELMLMRRAAAIAGGGFAEAEKCIQPGLRESEVAARVQAVFDSSPCTSGIERSYGSFYCMSGPNSAKASAAYARTRQRVIEEGDLVMVHANTCADGYWNDITRTYTAGKPDDRQRAMRTAIQEAREAALAAIRPGAQARAVDNAARETMIAHGFGDAFCHSTGHGVGFAAANANSRPRIHPKSPDILEENMTFNIEPAAYFDGYGGMRHCDVVAVTSSGVSVITDF